MLLLSTKNFLRSAIIMLPSLPPYDVMTSTTFSYDCTNKKKFWKRIIGMNRGKELWARGSVAHM